MLIYERCYNDASSVEMRAALKNIAVNECLIISCREYEWSNYVPYVLKIRMKIQLKLQGTSFNLSDSGTHRRFTICCAIVKLVIVFIRVFF